ncbi:MAG TPA: hypothetical protein VGL95_01945 [Acetobacteraceae bacterium]
MATPIADEFADINARMAEIERERVIERWLLQPLPAMPTSESLTTFVAQVDVNVAKATAFNAMYEETLATVAPGAPEFQTVLPRRCMCDACLHWRASGPVLLPVGTPAQIRARTRFVAAGERVDWVWTDPTSSPAST